MSSFDLEAGHTVSHFRMEKMLGEGGMGAVSEACASAARSHGAAIFTDKVGANLSVRDGRLWRPCSKSRQN